MANKAEIKTIILSLGNKDVELTTEQAKQLHGLLDELFGRATVSVPCPYPVYIRGERWWWDYPSPTWSGSGSGTVTYSESAMCVSV